MTRKKRKFKTLGKKVVYFYSQCIPSKTWEIIQKSMPQFVATAQFDDNGYVTTGKLSGGGLLGKIFITMKQQLIHTYNDIISLENLCLAWREFIVGKISKVDAIQFEHTLMDNIISLHTDLANCTYRHGGYESFFVDDDTDWVF